MNYENLLKEDLPYEKFEQLGPSSLTDSELLAIIIRTGTKSMTAVELGRKIIQLGNDCGQGKGILSLEHLTLQELMAIKGIGKVKAIRLKCVAELSKRISKQSFAATISFQSPATIAGYYMEQLRHLEEEQIILIMTDNKNNLLNDMVISKGTVNMSIISPREIFLSAIKNRAVYILLVHNHPSGDPTPSKADIELTGRIYNAGKLLNIPLVDHVIIGDNTYNSLKELGYL